MHRAQRAKRAPWRSLSALLLYRPLMALASTHRSAHPVIANVFPHSLGHDLTYVDAADLAAKQTFEPQLASLTVEVITTRGSDPDQRRS